MGGQTSGVPAAGAAAHALARRAPLEGGRRTIRGRSTGPAGGRCGASSAESLQRRVLQRVQRPQSIITLVLVDSLLLAIDQSALRLDTALCHCIMARHPPPPKVMHTWRAEAFTHCSGRSTREMAAGARPAAGAGRCYRAALRGSTSFRCTAARNRSKHRRS